MRNKYAEHAHKFPPHCIADLNPAPVTDLPPRVDFAPVKADFRISCPCGEKTVHLLGYTVGNENYLEEGIYLDSLAIECPTCHRIVELFDRHKHGYDGENELSRDCGYEECDPLPDDIERIRYAMPCCGQTTMELMPGFGYSIEDFEGEELKRTQDFFDWFSLCGRCALCGLWQKIEDVECA